MISSCLFQRGELRKGVQCRPVFYWQASQFFADYLSKIDLFYIGADSIIIEVIQQSILQVTSYGTIAFMNVPSLI